MTPKEKANELLSKFVSISLSQYVDLVDGIRIRLAKECALIAVDEILKNGSLINQSELYKANKIKPTAIYKEYWQKVKQEIGKL